ncbi:2OG-Fe(II) oxygenase [Reichenbachiella ulvae]|uniref:2OG-Fe(II) oxygenase n=1 Tax=Reichenbachiella ulvae TaxID=2980104 RepID=A0ABT3D0W9_9BACT|nr:2OG-Fe(II) oxygenase [Reichenbachiella ulvae]MCV9389476.1 2OG-Fe(II) oxygenase [Reichenbachiella ulvae]
MEYVSEKYRDLKKTAAECKELYQNASPFPNFYLDDFFDEKMLSEVLEEFPDMRKKPDLKFETPNEKKLASKGESRFGPKTKAFMHYLNSEPFLNFLAEVSGIDKLIPDPYFEGAGCHQIEPGGMLKVHADFNKNRYLGLDRRLNFLIYLNKDWDESYGGHFELWDTEMKKCEKKILPLFNRIAMFSTTSFSYHGHPTPLSCPEDRTRQSIALYYYTNGRPDGEVVEGLEDHRTIFKYRKDDEEANKFARKQRVKQIVKLFIPPLLTGGLKELKKY